ncbi:MAG: LarC family nickel insertion protein [Defluviitaleaceae bacterium]|nr:LarC family nickel insertion protein [Defluviitaleaceae bacterium]
MKTLYFECSMGAAGDMLMAVLLELHDSPEVFCIS